MRPGSTEGVQRPPEEQRVHEGLDNLLGQMVDLLMRYADAPPRELQGVPDSFVDELERFPKEKLKRDMDCPICGQPFLDDPHPLVVQLPCNTNHLFDLECIQPWLKLNPTCPLDRVDLVKRKYKREEEVKRMAKEEDEDGDDTGMYG